MRKLLIPFEVIVLAGLLLAIYMAAHPDTQVTQRVWSYLETLRHYGPGVVLFSSVIFLLLYVRWRRAQRYDAVHGIIESLKSAAWELIREMENVGPSWKNRLKLAREVTEQFAVDGAAKLGAAQGATINNTDSSHNEIMKQVADAVVDRYTKDMSKFSGGLGALRDGVSIFLQIMDGRPAGAYTSMLSYMRKQASGKDVPNFDHLKEVLGITKDPPDMGTIRDLQETGLSRERYVQISEAATMPGLVFKGLTYTPLQLGDGEEFTLTNKDILDAMREYLRTLDIRTPS